MTGLALLLNLGIFKWILPQFEPVFADAGIDLTRPIGLDCGGGVAAAFEASVLHGLGLQTSLYVGSWSEWASDPARPRA